MRTNILIFCHSYIEGFIEASNQYTQLFDKNKYDVTVAYLVGKPDEAVRERHLTQHVIFLESPKKSTRGLKLYAIKKMMILQREKNFQIVICHRYKPSYVMLWVSRFYQIPVLFFIMSEMGTFSGFKRKYLFALFGKNNMTMAGVSNAVRDDLRRTMVRIPPERIITLYNMIDTDMIQQKLLTREESRQAMNLPHDAFIFGILARLAKAKDHQTLINAFALVKPECPNAKLVIMGHGVLEKTIREQIKHLVLENDIILTGFLPSAFSLLRAYDVFVLSSIQEAFGRVLLEAMIAKVPVIATKINGIPEVLGDTGTLFDPKNITQLAEKMITSYNMPKTELAKQGERGYQRVLSDFSIRRFSEIFWGLPQLIENGLA